MYSAVRMLSLLTFQTLACVLPAHAVDRHSGGQGTFWEEAEAIAKSIVEPAFPDRELLVTDFGAKSNGQELCTEAFRRAIAACNQAGGGRVVVPAGQYRVGAIHLRSNVNLHISEDATLRFSRDPRHYLPVVFTRWEGVECMNYSAFIYAFEQENIAVTGEGMLDGQADREHGRPWQGKREYGHQAGRSEQSQVRAEMFGFRHTYNERS